MWENTISNDRMQIAFSYFYRNDSIMVSFDS
jgi:hypothetical protein